MPEDCVPNNPYLDSLIYEGASLYSTEEFLERSKHTVTETFVNSRSDEYRSLYLRPLHAAQVLDPQLSDIKISVWTTVCKDDIFMRDLLGVFLRCEYHLTAAFQKDLFLEDMAAQREDFCSSLLVNVILGYSCVRYSQNPTADSSDMVLGLPPAISQSRRVLESKYAAVSLHR